MLNKDLKIKTSALVSFETTSLVLATYCKEFQTFKEVRNSFSGFLDRIYKLQEHKKHPAKIKLENHRGEYWVKCHETKTSYVFEIWYA